MTLRDVKELWLNGLQRTADLNPFRKKLSPQYGDERVLRRVCGTEAASPCGLTGQTRQQTSRANENRKPKRGSCGVPQTNTQQTADGSERRAIHWGLAKQ